MMRRTFAAALTALLMISQVPALAGPVEDALDDREMTFLEGVINAYDGMSIVVNEARKIAITPSTKFFDSSGRPSVHEGLKEGKWVYVEGYATLDGGMEAESVYMLPGYVGRKERNKYPFIQTP